MDFHEQLRLEGYTDLTPLNGMLCGLLPFAYTTGLVVGLGPMGYSHRYCFEREADARIALRAWNGKQHPTGPWIKCKGAGVDLLNPNWTRDETSNDPDRTSDRQHA